MAAIHGVESNVASRFIDHTVATPWETLLNDIESALRIVNKSGEVGSKVDIQYDGLTYRLEKRRSTNPKKSEVFSSAKTGRAKDFTWLHSTYNIGWFILFSHGYNSADYHGTYRTTMLSAFVTVIKTVGSSLEMSIPIFFSFSYVTDISQAVDLVGYQNLPAPAITSTTSAEQLVLRPRWCRYETHICPMLYFHPHFEYFDGIRKVLKNQLQVFRLAGPSADNFFVEAEFSFLYDPDIIYGSMRRNDSRSNTVSSEQRSQPLIKAANKATGVSIFNPNFLKRLSELIPGDEISCTLITEIQVELSYPSQPQNLIVDNAQHTSLLPSHQPPSCWNISVFFTNLPRMSLGDLGIPLSYDNSTRNPYLLAYHSAGGESALSASWMSLSVRKLLSFYILSVYCTRAKVNVETMSAEIESTANLLDKNVLDRINEVLSDESRAVFYAVCRQQIDVKLTTQASNISPPLPTNILNIPKGRMASVQKDAAPGNLASLNAAAGGGVASPARGGRTASIVAGSASAVSSAMPMGGSHSPTPASLNAVSANLFGGEDGGWSARMERHRAVVEILFSGECVFSEKVAQGSRLDCPVSSSVGLWMGMFSLLCASSAVDAHDMANIWSKCMRRVHIACEDGQPLPTFTPIASTTESTSDASVEIDGVSDKHAPICLRTLWDDAIERLHDEDTQRGSSCQGGLPLAWPDQKESVVVQKLQQLQFCIATQNESPVYQFPAPSVEVEVTHNAEATSVSVDKTENVKDQVELDHSKDFSTASTDPDQKNTNNTSTNTTSHSTTNAPATRRCTVQQPHLFRRLPLTEDVIAMNRHLARKLSMSSSRSNREHPTLKVQLQVPSILSDIKAFKAANPALDVYAFCAWYGIEPVSGPARTPEESATTPATEDVTATIHSTNNALKIPLDEISRAWTSCEAVACEEQGRALFLVEKESEKAMAYLESVTAAQLASEMLSSGIRLIFGILAKQFDPWLCEEVKEEGKTRTGQLEGEAATQAAALKAWKSKLSSDLALLKEQVENAVSSLRPDPVAENGTSAGASSSTSTQVDLNINTLIFVDSVAGLIQKLESLSIKLQTLGALFARSPTASVDSTIHTLSRREAFTAQTAAEMNALYELTRALHLAKEQTQDSQSFDGRELGEPTTKTFTCRLHPSLRGPHSNSGATSAYSATPLGAPIVSTAEPSAVSHGLHAGQTYTTHSAGAPGQLTSASSLRDIFHMQATVKEIYNPNNQNQKEKQLHVAIRVPEDEN